MDWDEILTQEAIDAYDAGTKPYSKWKKKDILQLIDENVIQRNCSDLSLIDFASIPEKTLKDMVLTVYCSAGTGKYHAETLFYGFDAVKASLITLEDIASVRNTASKVDEKEMIPARCRYLVWSGIGSTSVATEVIETGYIKGNWFFTDSGKKKKISAKGFRILQKL